MLYVIYLLIYLSICRIPGPIVSHSRSSLKNESEYNIEVILIKISEPGFLQFSP